MQSARFSSLPKHLHAWDQHSQQLHAPSGSFERNSGGRLGVDSQVTLINTKSRHLFVWHASKLVHPSNFINMQTSFSSHRFWSLLTSKNFHESMQDIDGVGGSVNFCRNVTYPHTTTYLCNSMMATSSSI